MAKQSYDKVLQLRSGRRSVRTRTCNKGTDAHAIKESIKLNRNINIDIDKGTAAKQIDFKKQLKQKGKAAAIKRTPLLPNKETVHRELQTKMEQSHKSIFKTHRGALEIEIFEPPVICCKYTPKEYKKESPAKYTANRDNNSIRH